MVKNFIPNCDLCGEEIPFGRQMRRNAPVDGMEVLMVALENLDSEFEFVQNEDGTVALDTCLDCYTRMPFGYSESVN
jgi:hypothetical protein